MLKRNPRAGVQRDVHSQFQLHRGGGRRRALAGLFFGLTFLALTPCSRADEAAAPTAALDELVYPDGDRVRGHLLEHTGGEWVFKSERFGVLRVADTQARVNLAHPPAPATAATAPAPGTRPAATEGEEEPGWRWTSLNPVQLARALKTFFGPWHGKLALSTELTSASDKKRQTVMTEGRLQRKWEHDDVQTTLRYDYSATNNVATTDTWKSSTTWRHDLSKRWFTTYEPTLEWNRAYTSDSGMPSDYLLVQQEIGVGVALLKRKEGQLSLGVSENLFDVWLQEPVAGHQSHSVESTFLETTWQLPWQTTVSNRGIYYYAFADDSEGWENRFQIDKKLTQTLSVGVRHEVRHNNPDVRISDYTQLKLLLGLDF